jgi:hypothetical protein
MSVCHMIQCNCQPSHSEFNAVWQLAIGVYNLVFISVRF